ncbi:ABZ1 Aminodeoxychorismate synthase [Candida maltosa Xu316]
MILLIDSYDSFTNNLAHLLKSNTNTKNSRVITIHNDSFSPEEYESFYTSYLPLFEYIVIGPGPGHPSISSDVGIISWLIKKFQSEKDKSKIVPILGICLGFQSLCYEFGNDVQRLDNVKHGQIYDIHVTTPCGLFEGVTEPFGSVRYHSLFVDDLNENVIPLAYCYEGSDKKKILMAMQIKDLPFYGVQYHPESICSSKGGDLISNFSQLAKEYNTQFRTISEQNGGSEVGFDWLGNHAVHEEYLITNGKFVSNELNHVYYQKIQLDKEITPVDVCDYYYKKFNDSSDFVLLNSASIPGEWSIIGFPISDESEVITHSIDDERHVYLSAFGRSSSSQSKLELPESQSIWDFVAKKMEKVYVSREDIHKKINNPDDSTRELPFWGGYIGIISYEEGQHLLIDKISSICSEGNSTPDLKLLYISRFIAFDHVTSTWYVVSINDSDTWGDETLRELQDVKALDINKIPDSVKNLAFDEDVNMIKFELPSQQTYKDQFNKCQEYLHSGDSYELCLTTQSKIQLPSYIKPWDIYKVLTLKKNPSPFSCFMEFDDCCLISSSPERFLSWKDDNEKNGKVVELRPIKGTVKNTSDVTFEMASKILKTPKEMGENLMIVDLIRHDLYQFTDNVTVSQLMAVEEYTTVYQLVSVIQGKLQENNGNGGFHGIDLLHRSLPPGSMTGAPKKRSVELLQDIESMQGNFTAGRRGIYSGVVGYWSITDDSDWSVIIRSVIGAGGAITVLSDEDGEWEEMILKLTSALQAFK